MYCGNDEMHAAIVPKSVVNGEEVFGKSGAKICRMVLAVILLGAKEMLRRQSMVESNLLFLRATMYVVLKILAILSGTAFGHL